MAGVDPISFLTDEDVPDSVGNVLQKAGHEVWRVRDVLVKGSPDKVVAAAARESDLVLVTHNYRDFRKEARDHLSSTNKKVDKLRRIELLCKQPQARSRLEKLLPYIELALREPRLASDPGVRISITGTNIQIAHFTPA